MRTAHHSVLRRDLFVAVVGLVAFVLLMACVFFAWHQHATADRAAADVEKRFSALRSELSDKVRRDPHTDFETWAERRCTNPYVALLAVFDANGQPLVVASGDEDVRRALSGIWLKLPTRFAGSLQLDLPDQPAVDVVYRRGPIPELFTPGASHTLLVAQFADHLTVAPGSPRAWLSFYLPVVGLSALTLIIVLVRMNRNILVPVVRLIEAADAALGRDRRRGHPEDVGEIRGLAAAVEDLRAEKEQWREQATNLKLHVERRVDARTRQISRELRGAFRDAATDPLTSLGNRRTLDEHLPALIEQANQLHADLTLVLLDIDAFKTINDRFGHAAGDEVLQFVGRLLAGCLRDEDIAVRMGGDEFLLLLPGVRATQANAIVQRIVALFRQQGSSYDVDPPLTMSAGIVSLEPNANDDAARLLEYADRALYAAKQHGRDAIHVHDPSMANEPALH